jgi:hypothetical protein
MFKSKTHKTVATLLFGVACISLPRPATAALPVTISGIISGVVSNSSGVPQMGATVLLFNRQERLFQKIVTDASGRFNFLGLFPDAYSVRVSLTSFVPAFKQNVLVQPGMRSILNVSLNSLFSTIQVSYPALESGTPMTDEWKWVLRSGSATRPVLRLLPGVQPATQQAHGSILSDTRGLLRVSAGEGGFATAAGNEADLGTAFALATSLSGNNLQVSGNLGYGSQNGVPSAAFRTSYSRDVAGGSPEVSVTMRQLFLPTRLGATMAGNESALPLLRSLSAALDDRTRLGDHLTLQYGFTLESVSFLDRLTNFSPYARLSYEVPSAGRLDFTYTSGNARPELGGSAEQSTDLQRNLNSLALFPRLSLRQSRARLQRGEEYEVSYSQKVGSRTYSLSAYHERVSDAALSMVAPAGLYDEGDLLPDLFSGNSTFNAGNYQSNGYTAAVTQQLGEFLSASAIYGSMGALNVKGDELLSGSPDELRAQIRASRKRSVTARIAATAPRAGTQLMASYQFTSDHRWAMPGNVYSTASIRPQPGLNIFVRQPIPGFGSLPWRMEATADLRNLLAQGYLPISLSSGQSLLLVETPRSIRGGLAFIF